MSKVKGYIAIRAQLTNTSPLLMGDGEGEQIDKQILRDSNGKPYISGSALAGAIRNYCFTHLEDKDNDFEYFWGSETNKELSQSHLIIENAYLTTNTVKTAVRDGVAIDETTGMAIDKSKYDYELLEPNHTFELSFLLKIREDFEAKKEKYSQLLDFILLHLSNGSIRLGAHTSFGFGLIALDNVRYTDFNFKNEADRLAWFMFRQSGELKHNWEKKTTFNLLELRNNESFKVTGTFKLASTLLIGGGQDKDSDKSHLTSNGKPIIGGKSFKGPIRHRMKFILNVLGKNTEAIQDLMGFKNKKDTDNKVEHKKSRLTIEENVLTNTSSYLQHRIKIDRFTQGVIPGAKFDSKPLFAENDNESNVILTISIANAKNWEKALLMHIVRDIATGDLRFGGEKNIGRGQLQGLTFEIDDNGQKNNFTQDGLQLDKLSAETIEKVNLWQNELMETEL